ncbi:IS3 family transposase [Shimia sp. CNT1-13L.2]|uniref:IS3 family transposase n=1 Tax=Shimia sp. CNT1-13L.2 TaxID=2959663 RepID=UPI0020CBE3F5|nr:IS3 family transposase [Shimia sp. CNT1-13L.2]MCP9483468.1 IS3 family transposase [Shimia sp. CNT1-13L.2]
MGSKRTDEFRQDAVPIALTSGFTRKQVASDLGVRLSTLNKWITAHRVTDVVSKEDLSLAQENERIRREVRILKEERDILKKGHPVLRGPKTLRFRFIEEHRGSFSAKRLCHVVGVSTRGLRAFRTRPASCRQRSDMVTLAHIKEQSRLSLGSYGRPRMTEELKQIGLNVVHRRVGRLMRQNGISVVRSRKHKVTTDSEHKFNIAPNLLDRDFTADKPNQKWAGDNSYVWTREGWLYLAVILDLHSRRVIRWAVSNRMKRDLAIRALKMAIALGAPPKDCIHHTDRGSQYRSHDYQKLLRQHGFKVSMNGKGNCYDNAAVETFFKTIKAEMIWRRLWETRRQTEMAIFEYINGFYNTRRRHSVLGWKSPVAFERKVA